MTLLIRLFDFHEYNDVVNNFVIVNFISNKIYDVTITLVRNEVVVFTNARLQREKEKQASEWRLQIVVDICFTFGTPIQFVGKAITAEALAIREAMETTIQKCWSKVHTLSDANKCHTNVAKKN